MGAMYAILDVQLSCSSTNAGRRKEEQLLTVEWAGLVFRHYLRRAARAAARYRYTTANERAWWGNLELLGNFLDLIALTLPFP
jgi:hypothetical protein